MIESYSSSPEDSTDSIDGVFLACMRANKRALDAHSVRNTTVKAGRLIQFFPKINTYALPHTPMTFFDKIWTYSTNFSLYIMIRKLSFTDEDQLQKKEDKESSKKTNKKQKIENRLHFPLTSFQSRTIERKGKSLKALSVKVLSTRALSKFRI